MTKQEISDKFDSILVNNGRPCPDSVWRVVFKHGHGDDTRPFWFKNQCEIHKAYAIMALHLHWPPNKLGIKCQTLMHG